MSGMTTRSLGLLGLSLAAVSATLGARVLSEHASRPQADLASPLVADADAPLSAPAPAAPVTLAPVEPVLPAGGITSSIVSFVGSVEQTEYGAVQVAVTFHDGEITAIDLIQSPGDDETSAQLSEQAVPVLAERVLAAQGTEIDGVSGATYTSAGYLGSVQAAIDEYRASLE